MGEVRKIPLLEEFFMLTKKQNDNVFRLKTIYSIYEKREGTMNKKIILLVAFAAFLGPFTQNIYVPLLPELQQQFHTTTLWINATLSIFTFMLAIMQMVYGPIVDMKGRKKVLIVGLSIYVVATIGCILSDSITTFLLFRGMQATGIAAGTIVGITVIGDLFEGPERGKAMSIFQMLVSLGPAVGPIVGGWVGQNYGHSSVFLILAIVGTIMLFLNALFLKETKPKDLAPVPFEWKNYLLAFTHPVSLMIIGLGALQFFVFHNYLALLAPIVQNQYGITPSQTGFVFFSLAVMMVIGTYIGGELLRRFDSKKILLVTATLHVLSVVLFVFTALSSFSLMLVSLVLFGLCLGLSGPVQTTLLIEPFPNNRGTVVGTYNFMRFIGMASGPIVGSLLFKESNMILPFIVAGVLFAAFVAWMWWFMGKVKKQQDYIKENSAG